MKQYDYQAMHQACINWCEDENRGWPEFLYGFFLTGFFLGESEKNPFYEIRTPDNHWVVRINVDMQAFKETDSLLFAKFIELNLSEFEIKPMTKRKAVEDYLKDFKIGDELVGGIKMDKYGFTFKDGFVSFSWIDSKAIAEWNYAMLFHALKLDQHEKYKDAI